MIRKVKLFLVLILFSLLGFNLSSCVSQVTTMKIDEGVNLDDKSGYLLVAVDTNYPLDNIVISGKKLIRLTNENLKQGSNYILTPLPAGKYKVSRVFLNQFFNLKLNKGMWDFEIAPNTISYVGHLEVTQRGSGLIFLWTPDVYVELVNRSSQAIEFLEEKFPKLLSGYNLTYNGPGEDDFFNLVRKYRTEG